MILSDADILRRLEAGDLAIEPLEDVDMQVQPASVDLRLGTEFLEFQRTNISCIHPTREEEVGEYVAETTVPEGGEFILHPGDFVLGTTKERVEIPPDLVAHVEGRSSLGRLAVVVHASLPADEEVFLWTPEAGYGFYEIGDVVETERPARAVSFDPRTLRVSTHRVTDYIRNPERRIYRVTLASGREVRVTRDHNLFTVDGAGRVTRLPSEAAVGEHVLVPGSLPTPRGTVETLDLADLLGHRADVTVYAADGAGSSPAGSRSVGPPPGQPDPGAPDDTPAVGIDGSAERLPRSVPVTAGLGWLLGVYLGGGTVADGRLTLPAPDRAGADRLETFFEGFGTHVDGPGGTDGSLTVRSPVWAAVLRALCGTGGAKTVPDRAWNWPTPAIEALQAGLLAGSDGPAAPGDGAGVLRTPSAALADRATYLGSRLGLRTELREPGTRASDDTAPAATWTVTFGRTADGDPVPVPGRLLRSLREAAGYTCTEATARLEADDAASGPPDVRALEEGAIDLASRGTLRRLRDVYAAAGADTTRLDQLLADGLRFDRVAGVEATGRVEPTYDLEVQPRGRPIENFLGGRGGVFLSNTAGLCDPGYNGQITLELSNLGTAPVALTPGMRVSQLTFTELSSPAERPYGAERGSKYQDQAGPQASRIGDDPEFET